MEERELTAGRIAMAAGVLALITACIYLVLAIGAGSTEYSCEAKGSCSTTIVPHCRKCDLQSTTTAGILSEMRSSAPCGPNPFKSVREAPGSSPP
jgi:hypothetical protein